MLVARSQEEGSSVVIKASMAFCLGAGVACAATYHYVIRPLTLANELSAEMGFLLITGHASKEGVSPKQPSPPAQTFREVIERADNIEWIREELLRYYDAGRERQS